jgi:oxygen-independent coproporphyrinogen-3 oxidase
MSAAHDRAQHGAAGAPGGGTDEGGAVPTGLATLQVDEATLLRLAGPGPRYTSYPTAPEWRDDFGTTAAYAAYRRAAEQPELPLSLYVHLPFCERLCLYCGCTVEIHGKQSRADRYLDAVERELEIVGGALGARRRLAQMHWGGGTPTFLSEAQLARLHKAIARSFAFDPGAEISIEVDPHVTTPGQTDLLTGLGFNRISMGVQDFDETVQKVVRRDQTVDETERLVRHFRRNGVEGINIDLMYGLPEQTEAGFAATLERIEQMRPDRLAVFGYAHVPWLKPVQKTLETLRLPGPVERAALFGLALARLGAAGYEVIGLDHFALPQDSLTRALHAGRLHRNFMGYTTQPAADMAGLGMSAIGDIGGAFLQNARSTKEYEPALAAGRLSTVRGLRRSAEDDLRRATILSLMCRMRVDLDELERETGRADLAGHYAQEWSELMPFASEGLCTLGPRRLDVTPKGRLFLRQMAMPFDAYLRGRERGERRFSQTV